MARAMQRGEWDCSIEAAWLRTPRHRIARWLASERIQAQRTVARNGSHTALLSFPIALAVPLACSVRTHPQQIVAARKHTSAPPPISEAGSAPTMCSRWREQSTRVCGQCCLAAQPPSSPWSSSSEERCGSARRYCCRTARIDTSKQRRAEDQRDVRSQNT